MSRRNWAGVLKDKDGFPLGTQFYFVFQHTPVGEIDWHSENVHNLQSDTRQRERRKAFRAVEFRHQIDIGRNIVITTRHRAEQR